METLEQIVHRNLDIAQDENDFVLTSLSAEELALDLIQFCNEVEQCTESEISPFCQTWLDARA